MLCNVLEALAKVAQAWASVAEKKQYMWNRTGHILVGLRQRVKLSSGVWSCDAWGGAKKLADNNNWQRKSVQTRVKGERVGPTSKHLPHSQAPLHLSCIARNVYPISFTKSKGICTFDSGKKSFWSSEWLYLHFPEDASPGFWSLHSFFFDQVFKNTFSRISGSPTVSWDRPHQCYRETSSKSKFGRPP